MVIVTLNEEARLPACLDSVDWAAERLVVDTGSSDRTRELAVAAGARVVERPWEGFGPTKSAALGLARGDWVLLLDADERLTPDLRAAIEAALALDDPEVAAYAVCRRSLFLGRWMRHGGWYPDWVVRLVRRDRFTMTADRVHERLLADGPVERLAGDLLHETDPDLQTYLKKMVHYAALGGQALAERQVEFRPSMLCVRPAATFFKRLVWRSGWRDGLHGWVLAGLSSVHVFLKYAHLWERQRGEGDG